MFLQDFCAVLGRKRACHLHSTLWGCCPSSATCRVPAPGTKVDGHLQPLLLSRTEPHPTDTGVPWDSGSPAGRALNSAGEKQARLVTQESSAQMEPEWFPKPGWLQPIPSALGGLSWNPFLLASSGPEVLQCVLSLVRGTLWLGTEPHSLAGLSGAQWVAHTAAPDLRERHRGEGQAMEVV